jgi:hypothetical protein
MGPKRGAGAREFVLGRIFARVGKACAEEEHTAEETQFPAPVPFSAASAVEAE